MSFGLVGKLVRRCWLLNHFLGLRIESFSYYLSIFETILFFLSATKKLEMLTGIRIDDMYSKFINPSLSNVLKPEFSICQSSKLVRRPTELINFSYYQQAFLLILSDLTLFGWLKLCLNILAVQNQVRTCLVVHHGNQIVYFFFLLFSSLIFIITIIILN